MQLSDGRQSDDDIVAVVVSTNNARLLQLLVKTAMAATGDSLQELTSADEKLKVVNTREGLLDINDALDLALLLHREEDT